MMKGTQDVPLTDLLSKVVNDKINARNRLGLMTWNLDWLHKILDSEVVVVAHFDVENSHKKYYFYYVFFLSN